MGADQGATWRYQGCLNCEEFQLPDYPILATTNLFSVSPRASVVKKKERLTKAVMSEQERAF
jgi:hypothetical protein